MVTIIRMKVRILAIMADMSCSLEKAKKIIVDSRSGSIADLGPDLELKADQNPTSFSIVGLTLNFSCWMWNPKNRTAANIFILYFFVAVCNLKKCYRFHSLMQKD